jgi:hypothetical protein
MNWRRFLSNTGSLRLGNDVASPPRPLVPVKLTLTAVAAIVCEGPIGDLGVERSMSRRVCFAPSPDVPKFRQYDGLGAIHELEMLWGTIAPCTILTVCGCVLLTS